MTGSTRWLALFLGAALAAAPATARSASDDRVTMSLDGALLSDVLESFAVQYQLNIVAGSDVTGTVTMNLFEVPVEEALDAVLQVNGYGFRREGNFYFIERQTVVDEVALEPMETAVIWLDYLTSDEAMRMTAPLRSADGVFTASSPAEGGVNSDPSQAGGNDPAQGDVVVIRDYESIVEQVRKVLEELDRRPRQVLVESSILEVLLDDTTKFGIDFNTLFGLDFKDLNATSDRSSITLEDATAGQIEDGFASVETSGFANDLEDGLQVGILTSEFAMFVEALERMTETTVLANPRVLVVDRQPAEILIGAKLGYRTTTTTETATLQTVEFLDIGTQLRFRPYISDDDFIRLEIHPESSIGVVDSDTGLPSESTTEVTTNVMVRDGNTIAIGGLISEQVESGVESVPYLGAIPLVGQFFRSTIDSVVRREVIVLLTPHIFDGGAPDAAGVEHADALANTRDLTFWRQQPISRVRMAAPFIERAERALADGRAQEAVQYAQCALNLTPSDTRAAKVRMRALAALGLEDEQVRTLRALEGFR